MRILVAVAATLAVAAPAGARHPLAVQAEDNFFRILNHAPEQHEAAGKLLTAAFAVDPEDARTNLLLGLYHLWRAEEGDQHDPSTIAHPILAAHFLARATRLNPADGRIASWLVPAELSVAAIERQPSDAMRTLHEAYARDPWFHAAGLGFVGIQRPRDSAEFREGLVALRKMADICRTDKTKDCNNRAHWPHRVEGLLTFRADYELRAGNLDEASALLRAAAAHPDFARWRYKGEVERRAANLKDYAARYANADPKDDPPTILSGESGVGCLVCHRD